MEPATASLTPEQKETYEEFVLITGANTGDTETEQKVVTLLENHSFNLNNSVLSFFENGIENVVSNRRHASPPSPSPQEDQAFASGLSVYENSGPIHRNLQDEFVLDHLLPKLPKAPKISNTWQFDLGIHMSRRALVEKEQSDSSESPTQVRQELAKKKPSIPWVILLIIPKALSMLFSFFKFLLGLNTPPLYQSLPRLFNYDAYSPDYVLEDDLGMDVSDYRFASSDFNKCHEHGQKDFDFVLALLVDSESIPFCRHLLLNDALHALIGKEAEYKETRVYVGNVDKSPEAFEVMQTYKPRRIPYLMLLGNVSNNPSVMSSMSVVYKSNLLYDQPEDDHLVNKIVRNISKCMSNFNPQLVSKRFDKEEMEFSRLLKVRQDEAYLESLEQDKVKKQEKEVRVQKEKELQHFLAMKSSFLGKLKTSEWFDKQVETLSPKETIRVSFKLPDGRRVIQKFKKSMPLNYIFVFVELQLQTADEPCSTEVDCNWNVDEYCDKNNFTFEMFKPFPKLEIPSCNDTIECFGELKSGDTILVEYLVESDEDSSQENND